MTRTVTTRTVTVIALAAAGLMVSTAAAQSNDHFARQRQEAVARQAALQQRNARSIRGHWGGPTTTRRWYPSTRSNSHQQNVQFYPVSPFGYGVSSYGFYGGYSPYYGVPQYRVPHYRAPAVPNIYIHREIHHSR
jgi:hypothetical protein